MAAYFFDSSAMVKRFARETGTAWVINLLKPANGNRIYIARITYVEVVSAIIRRVKNNSLSRADGAKSLIRFRRSFNQNLLKIELSNTLIDSASLISSPSCYFEFIAKLYCQIDKGSHILSSPPT